MNPDTKIQNNNMQEKHYITRFSTDICAWTLNTKGFVYISQEYILVILGHCVVWTLHISLFGHCIHERLCRYVHCTGFKNVT